MNKNLITPLLLSAAMLPTSGCSADPAPSQGCGLQSALTEQVDAAQVAQSHHAYVGDASLNAATDAALRLDQIGRVTSKDMDPDTRTRTLQMSTDPACTDGAAVGRAIRNRTVLMFAAISNLEEVTWTFTDGRTSAESMRRRDAEKILGSPLKDDYTTDEIRQLMGRLD